jgi:lanosterol synthase
MESLSNIGESYENSPGIRKACDFLLSKQMDDGGWGESYRACETAQWVNHEKSQVVNTAWALLSLMAVEYPEKEPIQKGIELIMSRQQTNGEWLQEGIEGTIRFYNYKIGVFNKNCMISYPNYKFVFCIWALGRYSNRYEK